MGSLTRRDLCKTAAIGAGAWMAPRAARAAAAAAERPIPNERPASAGYTVYFGDLHNHSAVGYAQGSMERAFDIAHNHLDFFAFTPHGWWPDIGHYENNIEEKWLKGFEVTRERWPEVIEMVRQYDQPGVFPVIAGYEWHHRALGDVHILFPDLHVAEYVRINDLRELQQWAKKRGALLIPHHPGNRQGHRGANIAYRDPEVSPVIEMFSEWGCAEHDRAPYPYVRHTEAGRWTRNTIQYYLAQGHRFGVIASTDDHLGYPGGYREGLAAILAKELTREAIFDALRNRRCYAVTGDRIVLDFQINGQRMGRELPYARKRRIAVAATGWDQIDRVEVLKNNRVIHRDFPMDRVPTAASWKRPVVVRFEYGWGPWPALNMTRTCDWDIRIQIEGGRIEAHQTCFQPGPLDEERRDKILERSDRHIRLKSFTALRQQIEDISTKGIVLRVRGGPETTITISLESPTRVSLTQKFSDLAESNEMLWTGDFPKESALLHRLVFEEHYRTEFTVDDVDGPDRGKGADWYYVRVVQANNQLAWSSPIWVEPQTAKNKGA